MRTTTVFIWYHSEIVESDAFETCTERDPTKVAKEVALGDLKPVNSLESIVISTDGVRLLEFGDFINDNVVAALQEFEFDPVVVADNDQDASSYIRNARYAKVPLSEVPEGESLGVAVYDDSDALLAQAGQKINEALRAALEKKGVDEVFVSKTIDPKAELRLGRLLLKLQQIKSHATPRLTLTVEELLKKDPIPEERLIDDPAEITEEAIDKKIDEATEEEMEEKPEGPPLKANIIPVDPTKIRAVGKVKKIVEIHDDVVVNTEQIFAQISSREKVDGFTIRKLAAAVISALVEDSKLTLNLSAMNSSKFYPVRHAINTVLFSAGIATQLGFSSPQVQELAYGALLHDVGMLRLKPELVNKPGDLSPQERLQLQKHPIIGLDILQSFSHLPKTAPLVVYQENERLDGSGYPKGRKRNFIHTYAKIVSAAAMYDAMVTDRPYRKGVLPYFAMENLLKQVHMGRFDSVVARGLLHAIGLFPVGSWVKLSDRSIARVIGANGDAFTRPVISVVLDGNGKQVDYPQPVDLSQISTQELKVVEPVATPTNIHGDIRVIGF